jgi:hypothetical protein
MRKTLKVTIKDRGEAKRYFITEMSGTEAEDWALELFFAMANAGVDIPEFDNMDELQKLGFAGIAQIGLRALGKIPYEKAKPLLDRMMKCVQFMPNPENDDVVRALVESDIEDVLTRLKLRKEVFNLHTDFLQAVKS